MSSPPGNLCKSSEDITATRNEEKNMKQKDSAGLVGQLCTSPADPHRPTLTQMGDQGANSAPPRIDDAAGTSDGGAPTQSAEETLRLAQLYHSSRRSRHVSPQQPAGKGSLTALPMDFPPMPLYSSISSSEQDWQEIQNAISSTDKDEWSFDIASSSMICNSRSSNSLSSMETEECADLEDVTFDEVFDEDWTKRGPKKKKTSSELETTAAST